MKIKKEIQVLQQSINALNSSIIALTKVLSSQSTRVVRSKSNSVSSTMAEKQRKKLSCRICGKPLPSRRWAYCSPECAKKGHRISCRKYARKIEKKNLKRGKRKWIPTKKEIEMFNSGKLSATQWKKHFGVKTYTGVFKKLGQLAMHVQSQ